MNSFLDYLKESSDCLYIYNRNFSTYGLPDKERYTVVVKDDWVCPEDWIGFDSKVYQIYKLSDWFNTVLNGELIGWECACLNKKYIIKEHVKLLMKTNPIQLRRMIDLQVVDYVASGLSNVIDAWEIVKNIKFSIQIIENHKIINFKEVSSDYHNLLSFESIEEIVNYINKFYNILKNMTNGMLKQEIVNKLEHLKKNE